MHECIALSLGKEPRQLIWDQIERFERRSSFVREYRNRLEIVRRAVRMHQLSHENPPKHVFEWALGIGLAYPENLRTAVNVVIGEQQDWKKLYFATNKRLEQTLLDNQEFIKSAEPQGIVESHAGPVETAPEAEKRSSTTSVVTGWRWTTRDHSMSRRLRNMK